MPFFLCGGVTLVEEDEVAASKGEDECGFDLDVARGRRKLLRFLKRHVDIVVVLQEGKVKVPIKCIEKRAAGARKRKVSH